MDGWMDGWMEGWMDGWMEGRMEGRKEGWMDGWMEGKIKNRNWAKEGAKEERKRKERIDLGMKKMPLLFLHHPMQCKDLFRYFYLYSNAQRSSPPYIVTTWLVSARLGEPNSLAMPKSVILRMPWVLNSKLLGFKSWMLQQNLVRL